MPHSTNLLGIIRADNVYKAVVKKLFRHNGNDTISTLKRSCSPSSDLL